MSLSMYIVYGKYIDLLLNDLSGDNIATYWTTFKKVERNGEIHAITNDPETYLSSDYGSFYFGGLKFTDTGISAILNSYYLY